MPVETIESTPMTEASHKSTFFRQSGWMMVATVVSGVFMSLVHVFSKVMSAEEYAAMGALFQFLNWMAIPAIGLQMVFAQQASAAVTDMQRQELVATVKAVMRWTFYIWLVTVVIAFLGQTKLVAALKLSNPAALWVTVAVGLAMLWYPIFQGLLQGRQNFLWLGWVGDIQRRGAGGNRGGDRDGDALGSGGGDGRGVDRPAGVDGNRRVAEQ